MTLSECNEYMRQHRNHFDHALQMHAHYWEQGGEDRAADHHLKTAAEHAAVLAELRIRKKEKTFTVGFDEPA